MKKTVSSILALLVAFILVISSSVVSFAAETIDSVSEKVTAAIAKMETSNETTAADVISAVRIATQESGAAVTWSVDFYKKNATEGLKSGDIIVVPGVNGAIAGVLNVELGGETKKVPFVKSIDAPMAEREYTVSEDEEFDIEDGVLISYNGVADLVIIPDGVTEIDSYCFTGNEDIKALIIPEGVESVNSLKGMTSLEAVNCPESLISFAASGNPDTHGYTFYTNKAETADPIKYVKISSSIIELPAGTFGSTQLEDFYIGPLVEFVGNWFLIDAQIKNIVIPTNVKILGIGAIARQGGGKGDEVLESVTILNPTMDIRNSFSMNNKELIIRAAAGSTAEQHCQQYAAGGDNIPDYKFTVLEQSISEVAAMAQWAVNNIYKDEKTDSDLLLKAAQAQNANADITIGWMEEYSFADGKGAGKIAVQSATDTIIVDIANAYTAEKSDKKDGGLLGGLVGGKDDGEEGGNSNLVLIIVIAVVAVLLIAVIVVLVVVLAKNKKNAVEDDAEDEEDEEEEETEDKE